MHKFLEWFTKATTDQRSKLALFSGSSVASIRLAAKGYRKEREVDVTADFAARLEKAVELVGGDLPVVRREDLCKACAECPYQLKCNATNTTVVVASGLYDAMNIPEQLG